MRRAPGGGSPSSATCGNSAKPPRSCTAALATALANANIDLVFTAGPSMRHLHEALPESLRGGHAVDADAIAILVRDALRSGDLALVKGSAGSRMGRVIKAIEQAAQGKE